MHFYLVKTSFEDFFIFLNQLSKMYLLELTTFLFLISRVSLYGGGFERLSLDGVVMTHYHYGYCDNWPLFSL